jgi:hypothetical protein
MRQIMARMYLHDAKLHSIQLQADHAVVLGITEEDGTARTALLTAVDRMRVFDLREGNTILEANVIRTGRPPIEVFRKLFDLDAGEMPDYCRRRIADIESGALTLVHIVPSYGAELIALCKEFALT